MLSYSNIFLFIIFFYFINQKTLDSNYKNIMLILIVLTFITKYKSEKESFTELGNTEFGDCNYDNMDNLDIIKSLLDKYIYYELPSKTLDIIDKLKSSTILTLKDFNNFEKEFDDIQKETIKLLSDKLKEKNFSQNNIDKIIDVINKETLQKLIDCKTTIINTEKFDECEQIINNLENDSKTKIDLIIKINESIYSDNINEYGVNKCNKYIENRIGDFYNAETLLDINNDGEILDNIENDNIDEIIKKIRRCGKNYDENSKKGCNSSIINNTIKIYKDGMNDINSNYYKFINDIDKKKENNMANSLYILNILKKQSEDRIEKIKLEKRVKKEINKVKKNKDKMIDNIIDEVENKLIETSS